MAAFGQKQTLMNRKLEIQRIPDFEASIADEDRNRRTAPVAPKEKLMPLSQRKGLKIKRFFRYEQKKKAHKGFIYIHLWRKR
jgi:hypothetical protein